LVDKFSSASVTLLKKPGHTALENSRVRSGPYQRVTGIVVALHSIRKVCATVAHSLERHNSIPYGKSEGQIAGGPRQC
jgi:hypothetical protein